MFDLYSFLFGSLIGVVVGASLVFISLGYLRYEVKGSDVYKTKK